MLRDVLKQEVEESPVRSHHHKSAQYLTVSADYRVLAKGAYYQRPRGNPKSY